MRFKISSARTSRIAEYLQAAGIKIDSDVAHDSHGNVCVFVDVYTIPGFIELQSKIEAFRESEKSKGLDDLHKYDPGTTPLVIDFSNMEITIYDFYMD